MNGRSIGKLSLALLALGGTALVAPALAKSDTAASTSGFKLTRSVESSIAQAQAALEANDTATALAQVQNAETRARTDDDRYVTNLVKYNVAVQAGRTAAASEAAAALVAANRGSPADRANLLVAQAKAVRPVDTRKAEGLVAQAAELKPDDADILATLAVMKVLNAKPAEAVETLDKAIALKKAAGQPAPDSWYARAMAIAFDAKLTDQAMDAGQAWVAAYPTVQNWHDALALSRTVTADAGAKLDLLRLARAAGALHGASEYLDYASLATAAGLAGEAKAVIAEGVQHNMLDSGAGPARAKVAKGAKGKAPAAVAKTALPALAKQARASANGKAAMSAADAALGFDDYTQAAELYRLALTKGGVDAAAANTRLGIALARSGDKAGAAQALAQVTGPRATVAKFWAVWAGQPG
jgi:hypothetical protein